MKKSILISVGLVVVGIAGFFAFRTVLAQYFEPGQSTAVSKQSADDLQVKIDRIKKADSAGAAKASPAEVDVSEAELESYVLFELRDKIPVQMDSIHIQLTPGEIGAETQLTFTSSSTGNSMVDSLIGGTHNLFVKGKLAGADSRGQFELEEIKVDGIPMPKVLIQTLFSKYVKPKYPDADLKEPFDLPWGIRAVDIQQGTAKITY